MKQIRASGESLPGVLFANTADEMEAKLHEFEDRLEEDMAVRIIFSLNRDLHIRLRRGKRGMDEDRVEIRSGGQTGEVPRHTDTRDEGVTVSTSQGDHAPYMCVHLFPDVHPKAFAHPTTDRGLCWAYVGDPGQVFLTIHGWGDELFIAGAISKLIQTAEERVNEEIDGALASSGQPAAVAR